MVAKREHPHAAKLIHFRGCLCDLLHKRFFRLHLYCVDLKTLLQFLRFAVEKVEIGDPRVSIFPPDIQEMPVQRQEFLLTLIPVPCNISLFPCEALEKHVGVHWRSVRSHHLVRDVILDSREHRQVRAHDRFGTVRDAVISTLDCPSETREHLHLSGERLPIERPVALNDWDGATLQRESGQDLQSIRRPPSGTTWMSSDIARH
mmetsp:Transcript_52637/g.140305  ORF Transcript_52637/g.140305 Transcript_52637/m.140305 type:complete len:204 (+) Transcript_52637:155-766(+)